MTTDTPKNIAETIIAELRSVGSFETVSSPSHDDPLAPTIISIPKDMVLHDLTGKAELAQTRNKPMRRTGKAVLSDLASLIEWTNRFKGKESVLFGQINPNPQLLAVIDYHGEGAPQTDISSPDPTANYGHHRALYSFPVSEEWKRWTQISGAALAKDEFGEFIEDNAKDLLDPSPALLGHSTDDAEPWEQRMIEIAGQLQGRFGQYSKLVQLSRDFQVYESGHLVVTTNRDTGEANVQFLTEHKDPAGQPLSIPNIFMIAIPVFEEGALYRMVVRFRYRKAGDGVKFILTLHNPDIALRDAAREAMDQAKDATGLPLLLGQPETSSA